jgi:hypothetical protein
MDGLLEAETGGLGNSLGSGPSGSALAIRGTALGQGDALHEALAIQGRR